MATILPDVRPASPAATVASSPATAAVPQVAGLSAACFVGYLMVQGIEYGALGVHLPVLKVMRLTTLLSYLLLFLVLARYKGLVFQSKQAKLFATFVVFTSASILWAVVRSYVPLAVRYHVDYFGLFVITAFIIDSKARVNALAVLFTAIPVLLVATNTNMLGQDIRFGSFAAAYFMSDGNDFGWGLMVMLPFAIYLMIGKRSILTRLYALGGFLVSLVGIVGTGSRGATLAFGAAMILFWFTVAKRKLLFVVAAAVMVIGVLLLAPPSYFQRMNTIQNYEEDESAQGRLRAWRAARQMALDYPLGVGANNFNSAYGRFYIPADRSGWAANRWMSTHSCYFKVLAEYGYPGLTLFLSIMVLSFRDNILSARRLRLGAGAAVFDPEWPLLLNVGILGYAVCALFLGGITYPHLYILAGLTVAVTRMSSQAVPVVATAPSADATRTPAPQRPASRPRVLEPRPTPGDGRFF